MFHHGFGWAQGGYLGVDLFFVLSGFLIAGKLIDERRATGRIDPRRFWAGRFRRLLPALLLLLLGVVAYTAWFAPSTSQHSVRIDVYASLAYVVNWRFITESVGYFAATGPPSPVRHLWSLSVEEQFYFVFPVLLIGLARVTRSARQLLVALVALVTASTAWTAVLAGRGADFTRLYEGTDTRLATILLGAVGAVAVRSWRRPPRWLGPAAGGLGVVAVAIVAVARGDAWWMYPTGQLAFAVAVAVVVVACATLTEGRTLAVLGSRPLVWVGLLSYSLYLWHWPIYLVLTPDRTGLRGTALLALRIAVSVLFAFVSYVLVEDPIHRRRVRFGHPGSWAVAGVALVAVLITVVTAGAPTGDQLAARSGERTVLTTPTVPREFAPLDLPPGVTLPPPAPRGRPLRLAIVGDSVGFSLDYYSPDVANVERLTGTIIGCGVMAPAVGDPGGTANPDCLAWKDKWRAALDRSPDTVLMVTGAWETRDHWLDGEHLVPGSEASTRFVDGQLEQAYDLIRSETPARIVALALPCSPKIEMGVGEAKVATTDLRLVDWYNQRLEALEGRHPGEVLILSINDHLCPDGKPVDELDGVRLRTDGLHWSEPGAAVAWDWILPRLFDLAYRPSS